MVQVNFGFGLAYPLGMSIRNQGRNQKISHDMAKELIRLAVGSSLACTVIFRTHHLFGR